MIIIKRALSNTILKRKTLNIFCQNWTKIVINVFDIFISWIISCYQRLIQLYSIYFMIFIGYSYKVFLFLNFSFPCQIGSYIHDDTQIRFTGSFAHDAENQRAQQYELVAKELDYNDTFIIHANRYILCNLKYSVRPFFGTL